MRRICMVVVPWGLLIAGMAPLAGATEPVARWAATPEKPNAFPRVSGSGASGVTHHVDILWKVEDLVDHPSAWLNGNESYIEIADNPAINPRHLTLSVWFKVPEGIQFGQKPLVLKSAPHHDGAMYQYGLFVADNADYPKTLAFYLGVDGESKALVANDAPLVAGWNRVSATYDGSAMRLYCNGRPCGEPLDVSGTLDTYDTPLLFGAYGNLPKTPAYCFEGYLSEVALFDEALEATALAASYTEERKAYPEAGESGGDDPYSRRLNAALEEGRDVWGEALIAGGGASYENMKDMLRPLFFSTGHVYTERGVHNLLFGRSGGDAPYVVPLADGSRIAANVYQSQDYLEWRVGASDEVFGADRARLDGPRLDQGWLPVLQTGYTDQAGNQYAQESFGVPLEGYSGVVAVARMTVTMAAETEPAQLALRFGDDARTRCRIAVPDAAKAVGSDEDTMRWQISPGKHTFYLLWSPADPLHDGTEISATTYEARKDTLRRYWAKELERVSAFTVPEGHVMDAQRNLLIQNLIMRWRYSLGSVVYHDSFYQPESSDAVQTLGEFGAVNAFRDGLTALLEMTKGPGYYENWERGEKLSHGARYYYLTRDSGFIEEHTAAYVALCEEFRRQMAEDEYGLLLKQRQCGDIPEVAHYIFHQTVGWQGLRDMAEVWKAVGRQELYDQYRPLADELKARIDAGMAGAVSEMDNGSLFVPRALHTGEQPYDAITETRVGSYWNLVMPYGFASGYWPMDGPELGRIVDYMHTHGGLFLGLLRFNYYPTPIGAYRRDGLPGYDTTGVDNVYLPAYLRVLAAQDMAERQVLTFYGKLAHGMTRDTFVTGEGTTLGTRPDQYYRSTYGGPSSANNTAFLLNLRLMLVRESFNHDTGVPEGLYLAHATPRGWLEDGKEIVVDEAPTCFGPVSYRIASKLAEGVVHVALDLPTRNPMAETKLKLRLSDPWQITSATVGDGSALPFDAATGIIDLSGMTGTHEIVVTTKGPQLLRKDVNSK